MPYDKISWECVALTTSLQSQIQAYKGRVEFEMQRSDTLAARNSELRKQLIQFEQLKDLLRNIVKEV